MKRKAQRVLFKSSATTSKKTTCLLYKDQLVNAAQRNNRFSFWEQYATVYVFGGKNTGLKKQHGVHRVPRKSKAIGELRYWQNEKARKVENVSDHAFPTSTLETLYPGGAVRVLHSVH